MPTGANWHIDQYLTNFSVGYSYPEFVGSKLAPTLLVRKQSDLYRVWGAEAFNTPANDRVAPGATANEIDYALSNSTYYANGHAIRHAIPDRTRAGHDDPTVLNKNAVFLTKQAVELGKERTIATLATTVGNYAVGSTVTLAGLFQWDAVGNTADPFGDIEAGRDAINRLTGHDPNTLVMGRSVWNVAKHMAAFLDRIKYTTRGYLSPQLFAEAVDIENVYIGASLYNSAAEGQTPVPTRIWPDSIVLAYVDPSLQGSPSIEEAKPTAFTTFTWADPSLPVAEDGAVVYSYREEPRHSDVFEYEKYYDPKATFAGAAYLINDVLV